MPKVNLAEVESATGKKEEKHLTRLVDDLMDVTHDMTRQILDRITYRNTLYYIGEQYIEYVRNAGTFRKKLESITGFMPTPVDNEIKDFVRSLKAMLLNQKLIPKVSPNTNEPEDERAAELGANLLQWMDGINEGEIQDEKEKMIIWLALAGTAFLRTYPDMDGGEWFITKDGLLKTGEVVSRVVVPFAVRMDMMGDRMQMKRWIGIQSLQTREWVEDTFKMKVEAAPSPDVIDYQRRLMKLVAQVSPWKGAGLETSAFQEDEDLVLINELEFKPTEKYPNGRYVATCGQTTLTDVKRMPIKVEKGAWYYTLTDFHYDYVPGRYWSDAPVNDLISPQNAINEIDQMLAINRKGLGRPRVITPSSIDLERISSGIHAFLALKYDALLSGGQAPKIELGTPIPQQIVEERQIQQTVIQNVSGDPKHIMKGQTPSAASSGIQIDILRETAERGHYPDIERFNRAMGRVYKKRLILASELYTEKRQIKIQGRAKKINIIAFKGADLRKNTDLRLELDSGISSTKAGQTQLLMQLAEKGFLGAVGTDPEMKEEFLNRMGLSGYTSQSNVDIERAQKENAAISMGMIQDIFLVDDQVDPQGQGNPQVLNHDPLFKYDDHAIHFMVHRRFILSFQFSDMKAHLQTVLLAHTDVHESIMKQAQAAAQAAANPQGPQGGNGSPKTPVGRPGDLGGVSQRNNPLGEPAPLRESELAAAGTPTGGQ